MGTIFGWLAVIMLLAGDPSFWIFLGLWLIFREE